MSRLRQVEQRIESISALHDIVSSMRSLAGAYLQRAQGALESVRRFEGTVEAGLSLAVQGLGVVPQNEDPWLKPAIVAFTSDQGLCGPFVESLGRRIQDTLREKDLDRDARIFIIGQQGVSVFKRLGIQGEAIGPAPNSLDGAMACIRPVMEVLGDLYEDDSVSSVQLVYNVFEGVGKFRTRWRQLLPPDFLTIQEKHPMQTSMPLCHIPAAQMLHVILEEFLFIGLHRAMVEFMASENGSRMRAMDAATHNCEDMLEDLTSVYMQLRQEEITSELLDVASGAEAVRER